MIGDHVLNLITNTTTNNNGNTSTDIKSIYSNTSLARVRLNRISSRL